MDDFEDLIALSQLNMQDFTTSLYSFENRYYLYVDFHEDLSDEQVENKLSILLEYAHESVVSIYRLKEYGQLIIEGNALETIQQHFVTHKKSISIEESAFYLNE